MAPGCPPATGKTRTRVRANHAVNHVERASERASYPPVPSPRRLGTVLCLKWYTRMSGGTYYAVEAPCCDVGEAFLLPPVLVVTWCGSSCYAGVVIRTIRHQNTRCRQCTTENYRKKAIRSATHG